MRLPVVTSSLLLLVLHGCEIPRDEGTLVLRLLGLDRARVVSFHLALVDDDGRGERSLSVADLGAEDTVKIERVRVGHYTVELTASDDSGSRVQVGLAPAVEILTDETTSLAVTMASLEPGLCSPEQVRCLDGELGPVRSRCLDGQRWLPFELCPADQHCNVDTCTPDPCLPDPCTGHGEACAASGSGFACTCSPAYVGLRCDGCAEGYYPWPAGSGTCIDDPCQPDPCHGHADSCTPAGEAFDCACTAGYDGDSCAGCAPGFYEWPAGSGSCVDDPCTPDPCNGNATSCTAAGSQVTCTCLPAFRGERCDSCSADNMAYPACLPSSLRAVYVYTPPGDSALDLWITELDGGDLNLSTTPGVAESAPRVSPDRTRLAYYRDGEIWLMNIDGSDAHLAFPAVVEDYAAVYGLLWLDEDTLLINRRKADSDFRSERCAISTGVCTIFLTSADLAGRGDAEYSLLDVSPEGWLVIEGLERIWQPVSDLFLMDLDASVPQFLELHVDADNDHDDHANCRFDRTGTRVAWRHSMRAGWPSGDFWILSRPADLASGPTAHYPLADRQGSVVGWTADSAWIFFHTNGELGAVRADTSQTYVRIRGDHTTSTEAYYDVF